MHGAHLTSQQHADGQAFDLNVSHMRADLPTLAERFAAGGYRTVAITANDWLSADFGLTRGFEEVHITHSDADVIEEAGRQIAEGDARPLFLFVNIMAAHSPYRPGPGPWAATDPRLLDPETAPEWLRPYLTDDLPRGIELSREADAARVPGVVRYLAGELIIPETGLDLLSDLYDAGVRGADFAFGRILALWVDHDAEGIVAVTSDHGEALGEHGYLDHRGSVYPELLHVPLAIAAPGRLPAGLRVAEPVSLIELSSTLLRLAGLDAPSHGLIPSMREGQPARPISAMSWPVELWARHAGGRFEDRCWLYREGPRALVSNGTDRSELYDLARDPQMARNMADEEPERLAELTRRAHAALGTTEEAATTSTVDLPLETRARLRQLGYGD